jgi:hypothetical protein
MYDGAELLSKSGGRGLLRLLPAATDPESHRGCAGPELSTTSLAGMSQEP